MLGTVFHYAVVEPEDDHAFCYGQVLGIIAMHEQMGYKRGGAYNGHFCIHGGRWVSYLGPNQATGDTWANLNLHAWCYLGTVGTPLTAPGQQAAYDLTLVEPTGRDQIYPHSAFYATSCCGDPLRAWIAAGALPPRPSGGPTQIKGVPEMVVAWINWQGTVLAYWIDAASGRCVMQFSREPGAYGVPMDALAVMDKAPSFQMSGEQWASVVRTGQLPPFAAVPA